jgi:NAD(P)H-dependent flavin oxidoreductase YrpB (nitropropane dioxygenase family)
LALPPILKNLPLPVIGSPLFIISNPKLVIEQCKAGIVGAMPALNARPAEQLDEWLAEITETLAAWNRDNPDRPAAPFAINQIVHKSNERLEHDMQVCAKYKVPIVITSLGAREDVNQAVHAWGGIVLRDEYKQMIVASNSDDIIYSNLFTGVHGNYLRGSIVAAGMDPDNLPESDPSKMNFGGGAAKAWTEIWGSGQGIGAVREVLPAGQLVARLKREYQAARERLALA